MIDPRASRQQHGSVDAGQITKLPLPSHVIVWVDGRRRRGWLIGRSHEPAGWMGLVQYDDDQGREVTGQIPAEYIDSADR